MKFYNRKSSDMFEVRNGSVHLIVTSPPYPMIKKWDEMFQDSNFNRQHEQLTDTWIECTRVLCEGGIMCINIGDATRSTQSSGFCCWPNYAYITLKLMDFGMIPLIPIIWKKISNRPNAFLGSGMLPPNGYISQDQEYIAIFRKGPKLRKFPPKNPNRYASAFTKAERDEWFQQTWNIKGARNAKETSAFPEEIPYRLIRMFSVIGDTVLDPFCGTGTTMKVADMLNRNSIGYDIKEM